MDNVNLNNNLSLSHRLPNGSILRLVGIDHGEREDLLEARTRPTGYMPSDLDFQHMVHAAMNGHIYKRFDQADYEHAGDFSRAARSSYPGIEEWVRAQVAWCQANGLDPREFHKGEIARNPSLIHHVVDRGHRPKPHRLCFEEPDWTDLRPTREVYALYRLALAKAAMNDPRYDDPFLFEQFRVSTIPEAIRLVTSLYGQDGLDDILRFEEVQAFFETCPRSDFGDGGLFPNIAIGSASRKRRAKRKDMRYFDASKHWTKIISPHLDEVELNNVLVSDFNRYSMGFLEIPFARGRFPSDFRYDDLQSRPRGRRPRYTKYAANGACHWLVNFNLRLAMLSMPERSWRIITSDRHSTVWDGEQTLFDLTFMDMGVPPEVCFEKAYVIELPVGKYRWSSYALHFSKQAA